jgi:1-acyl-sn-glycerol-3-phosphate acyltransferase
MLETVRKDSSQLLRVDGQTAEDWTHPDYQRPDRQRPDRQQPARPRRSRPDLKVVEEVAEARPARPEIPALLKKRDPGLARKIFPVLSALTDHYYRSEIEGVEHLTDERSMVVCTHNGSINTPDLYVLMVAFWRRFGLETPGYGMMHRAAFRIPMLGETLERLGALPASRKNAEMVLDHGFPLLVCPGGDIDALKPYRQRHTITFGERRGFIRLAIKKQVPLTPVISVGAHETLFILNDGAKLARLLRLDKLMRVKSAPFSFSFPFGLGIAGLGSLPLPSKIKVRVLEPIDLGVSPEAADDPEIVEQCFERVRDTMQRSLDELASRRRWPIIG